MNTLADVKRRAQVGVAVHTHFPTDPFGKGDPPVRKIAVRQTNSIAFEASEWSRGNVSWLSWPKACDVAVEGDTFTVREQGAAFSIVYTFVAAA